MAKRNKGQSMFKLQELSAAADAYVKTGVTRKTARKAGTQKGQQKTTLQRSWTHNEELAVRCCGVIISRATFFQAEATSAVKVRLVHRAALSDSLAGLHYEHLPYGSLSGLPAFLHFLR